MICFDLRAFFVLKNPILCIFLLNMFNITIFDNRNNTF